MKKLGAFFIAIFLTANTAFQKVDVDFDAFNAPIDAVARVSMAADYLLLADASVKIVRVFLQEQMLNVSLKYSRPCANTHMPPFPHKQKTRHSTELNNAAISTPNAGLTDKFITTVNAPGSLRQLKFVPQSTIFIANHDPGSSIYLLLVVLLFLLYFHSSPAGAADAVIKTIYIFIRKTRSIFPDRVFLLYAPADGYCFPKLTYCRGLFSFS